MLDNKKIYLENSHIKIAYKSNNNDKSQNLITLHGWLDNANSFDPLTPYFKDNFNLYHLDLPGHGLSDHIGKGSDYLISLSIQHILEFTDTLKLESFHLVGHSLGAALASLIAGATPERIKTLTLIEGLGPFSTSEEELPKRITDNYRRKKRSLGSKKPTYKSIGEGALDRHLKTGLTLELCSILAERGLQKTEEGNYTWQSDPRLLLPSIHPLSEGQVQAFLRNIQAPTLVVMAEEGLEFPEEAMEARFNCLKNYTKTTFPGTHHLHMENPEQVAKAILRHCSEL